MRLKDLKIGMKVKFLTSPFDKKYTHGVVFGTGYTTRKAWVKTTRGEQFLVHTKDLLKRHHTFAQDYALRHRR